MTLSALKSNQDGKSKIISSKTKFNIFNTKVLFMEKNFFIIVYNC